MKQNTSRRETLGLADRVLAGSNIVIGDYRGRESAWDVLAGRGAEIEAYAKRYLNFLKNKFYRDRLDYIKERLEQRGYRPIADVTGNNIEDTMKTETASHVRALQKYYIEHEGSMVVAIQMGQKPVQDGINVACAHLDTIGIVGRIEKLDQAFNNAYILGTIRGGLFPKDYFGTPLSMYFYGVVGKDGKGAKRDRIVRFTIGENEDEPALILPEESYHLSDGQDPSIVQLEAIAGNRPHPDKSFDPRKRVLLNAMNELNKRFGITQGDLRKGELWLLPSQKPREIGFDRSLISGFGQDNGAGVSALLDGFIAARNPTYTKVAIFYDREEIGDTGRGSMGAHFFGEVIAPSLAYIGGRDLGDHYQMLMRGGWSLFSDVSEAIHSFSPEVHDKKDSPFLGSGVVISPTTGEEGNLGGYESSPEMIHAMTSLFERAGIPYQFGMMGTQDYRAGDDSAHFHQTLYTQGFNVGVPLLSMHRANEVTSKADLFALREAFRSFFSIRSHEKLLPQGKPVTLGWDHKSRP